MISFGHSFNSVQPLSRALIPSLRDGAYVNDMKTLKSLTKQQSHCCESPDSANLSTLYGMPIIVSKRIPENTILVVLGGEVVGRYRYMIETEESEPCTESGSGT